MWLVEAIQYTILGPYFFKADFKGKSFHRQVSWLSLYVGEAERAGNCETTVIVIKTHGTRYETATSGNSTLSRTLLASVTALKTVSSWLARRVVKFSSTWAKDIEIFKSLYPWTRYVINIVRTAVHSVSKYSLTKNNQNVVTNLWSLLQIRLLL